MNSWKYSILFNNSRTKIAERKLINDFGQDLGAFNFFLLKFYQNLRINSKFTNIYC